MIVVSVMRDSVNVKEEVECETLAEVAAIAMNYDWSPATFKHKYRNKENFLKTNLMVLDIDDGCTVEEAKELFKDYNHVILASKNHQKEKKKKSMTLPARDRFRVIMELDKPLDNEKDYLETWFTAKKIWPFIDEQCKDTSRYYYKSPEPLHVNAIELFGEFSIALAKETEEAKAPSIEVSNNDKGELSKSTLKFISFGAPDGAWHGSYIKACIDLKEQGYTQEEAESLLTKATGMLDSNDLYQLKHIYESHNTKYDKREAPPELIVPASNLVNEMYEYLENKDALKGESTGIDRLDKMLGGGFREGELTVLMAQAKTGKNTLYHYMLHKMLNRGQKQGYASRELDPATEVLPNILALELKKNLWTANITDEDKRKIEKAITAWPLYFAEGYGYFSEEALTEWITDLALQGVKSFWIDHFHYMLEMEDHNKTAALIRAIKTLAKKLKVHINLIVQPKTIQSDEKLNFNSMRGGAAITQALDNLLILERHNEVEEKNIAQLELVVARHKLARPGKMYLQYNEETTSFTEVIETTLTKKPQAPLGTGISQPNGSGFGRRVNNNRIN